MKKSRNRRALDMGKLKASGVLNWKKLDGSSENVRVMMFAYSKEPNSQFIGAWVEQNRNLKLYISIDNGLLHMSISHPKRYPTWDEILRTRYKFFPETVELVMYLPKQSDYVNVHPNCFHLFQVPPIGDQLDKQEPIGELVIEG